MTALSISGHTFEEAVVREVEIEYDAAWSAGDVERLFSLFTPNAVIINPYGEVWTGLGQIAGFEGIPCKRGQGFEAFKQAENRIYRDR